MTEKDKEVVLSVVRSDGRVYRFGTGTDWHIYSDGLENWARLSYEVETSPNVLTDGSSFVSKRVGEQDRTFSAEYLGRDQEQERERVISFFNAMFSFKAYLNYMGRHLYCEGEQYAFQCSEHNVYQPINITWTILCGDPYLKSSYRNDRPLDYASAGFGFPFVSHMRGGMPEGVKWPVGLVVSKLFYNAEGNVYNTGDVPCMYKVRIKANGTIVNPTIHKDDKFVRVFVGMESGDELVIDFEASPPTVTHNGEDVISKTDRGSSFTGMEMQVGKNVFEFTCGNNEDRLNAEVVVEYNDRYLGV